MILNNKGFTLIELLIGMAIMSVIIAGATTVFSTSLKSFQYSFEETSNVQDSRAVIDRISSELRSAIAIDTPAYSSSIASSGNRIDYTVIIDDTKPETRSIYIGTGDDSNTILIDHNNGKFERYALNRAQSITFIRNVESNRKITVNITLRNKAKSSSPTEQFTTVVTTLNSIKQQP